MIDAIIGNSAVWLRIAWAQQLDRFTIWIQSAGPRSEYRDRSAHGVLVAKCNRVGGANNDRRAWRDLRVRWKSEVPEAFNFPDIGRVRWIVERNGNVSEVGKLDELRGALERRVHDFGDDHWADTRQCIRRPWRAGAKFRKV